MKKFILVVISIKIFVAVLYCFIGFVQPHIIRQSVTMAVNQRYVIDWQHHEKSHAYLPRSLAGGDSDAILEMEFPFLNYLTVPAFFLETSNARTAGRLLCLFLFLSMWYWNYRAWKGIKILGIACEIPALLLLLLPISGMYFQRFMPDFFSFILCSTALGLSLKSPEKKLLPFLLAALGLLEKPTSIIVFGPLLLLEKPIDQIKLRLSWLVPSVLIAGFYYTKGTQWIRSVSDLGRYYETDFQNPFISLAEFFSQPAKIRELFVEELTTPYLPVILIGLWIWKKCPRPSSVSLKLWALLALQVLTIAILDGAHAFIHSYYYIGVSMTAALIWQKYFENHGINATGKFLIVAPLLIFNLERSYYELRDGFSPRPESTQALWKACDQLKSRHPEWPWNQGYSFRTEFTPVSEIGVCFGEIQSSHKNEYGFYWLDQEIPEHCQNVDQEGLVTLVRCPSSER